MSASLFQDDILFYQRLLSCASFYHGKLDGIWGPKTDAASKTWDSEYQAIKKDVEWSFDNRTENYVYTLLPKVQIQARNFLAHIEVELTKGQRFNLDTRIISGTRSYLEQTRLYRIGRYGDTKHSIVTNASAGKSNHNFGLAFDIGIFESGKYLTDSKDYQKLGQLSQSFTKLSWGGNWKSFKDMPHFEYNTGLSISEIKKRFELGKPLIVGTEP